MGLAKRLGHFHWVSPIQAAPLGSTACSSTCAFGAAVLSIPTISPTLHPRGLHHAHARAQLCFLSWATRADFIRLHLKKQGRRSVAEPGLQQRDNVKVHAAEQRGTGCKGMKSCSGDSVQQGPALIYTYSIYIYSKCEACIPRCMQISKNAQVAKGHQAGVSSH